MLCGAVAGVASKAPMAKPAVRQQGRARAHCGPGGRRHGGRARAGGRVAGRGAQGQVEARGARAAHARARAALRHLRRRTHCDPRPTLTLNKSHWLRREAHALHKLVPALPCGTCAAGPTVDLASTLNLTPNRVSLSYATVPAMPDGRFCACTSGATFAWRCILA